MDEMVRALNALFYQATGQKPKATLKPPTGLSPMA